MEIVSLKIECGRHHKTDKVALIAVYSTKRVSNASIYIDDDGELLFDDIVDLTRYDIYNEHDKKILQHEVYDILCGVDI